MGGGDILTYKAVSRANSALEARKPELRNCARHSFRVAGKSGDLEISRSSCSDGFSQHLAD